MVSRSDQEINLKVRPNIVEAEDQFGNKFKKRVIGIKIINENKGKNEIKTSFIISALGGISSALGLGAIEGFRYAAVTA